MLHLHRAERADRLADALGDLLRDPPDDVFAADVVAVPARGVERWLTQRLSHVLGAGRDGGDGVCARVLFPTPSALVVEALRAAERATGAPRDDPWDARRLVWPLLDVVDACAAEPWCAVLGAHLGAGDGTSGGALRGGRRLAAAAHLAALFASYGTVRPRLVQHWASGLDDDGAGSPLAAELAWQPELWRRLRAALVVPSPAERLAGACRALRADPARVDLPSRVSLFGPTRLTDEQLAVLAALADGREVHLWLPHPSPVLWDRVAAAVPASGASDVRRRADPTAALPRAPLLASLARDVRELQLRLPQPDGVAVRTTHHPLPPRPGTLLGRLQADLGEDRAPAGPPAPGDPDLRPVLAADDRSLQVHACYGPARQVEVLREVLLRLLAADPSLEPRDVLVMCPDVEAYAPLVSAAFGLAPNEEDGAATHPGHRLRVRLADRALFRTNPLLAVLATLLDLGDARVTASQVLDLASAEPVRRRFRLDDDELERVREWVASSGVRWGLDAEARAPWALQRVTQGTWRAGLDRVLLGVAMDEEEHRWLGLALPLDDVDSSDVDLAGRLAELVGRLSDVLRRLTGVQPLQAWLDVLVEALDLLTDVPAVDAWQRAQAARELADVREAAGAHARVPLALADVRALLADRLAARPTRAGFRTGSLTVCSLVPMRSVPHRVVCLLGVDDGVFPRTGRPDGDDVLTRDPRVGERDRGAEDRQLFLDALLAAREHLVVLHSGADERSGAVRPPAVPVGELLDVVDATVRTADGRPARSRVVVRHPLQPFDALNFTAGALGVPGPLSSDRSALRGARAARAPRTPRPPFLAGPLPAPRDAGDDVPLDELLAVLEHPVRGLVRTRLELVLVRDEEEPADALPVALDGLQRWDVGERLLRARLAGADADDAEQAEWRRGTLPPGPLGGRVLADVRGRVAPLLAACAAERRTAARTVDVDVVLADGRRLRGTVPDVHDRTVLRVGYATLAPGHRLRAWTRLLALHATVPEAWRAVTVGRYGRGVRRSVLGPVDPARAAPLLADLVALRDAALRAPLPLPVRAGEAYATVRRAGDDVRQALDSARKAWEGDRFPGERADREHVLAWGPDADLDLLLTAPAGAADGGPAGEPSRFGALARRLWDPLLAAETLERA